MSEELQPCPLCGGPAEIWKAHEDRAAWVACMGSCSVYITNGRSTTEEAIAVWNSRTPPRVKALPWKNQSARACSAKTAFGTYYLVHRDYYGHDGKTRYVGWECTLEKEDIILPGSVNGLLDCEKPEAEAAAQADFTRRVHACLEEYDD